MRDFCPFTNNTCEKEICALWLKHLEKCSFKEMALQMHGVRKEVERLVAIVDLVLYRLKTKN